MKENKDDGWESPQCNLCGSKRYAIVWDNTESWLSKGVFRIVKCRKCDLVYLSPRPTKNLIGKYYKPDSYWGIDLKRGNIGEELERRDEAYDFLYKDIFKRKKAGSILDVGAGTGLFLTKFKERGWEIEGVELSSQACKFAKRNYDIDLRYGDLLAQNIPANYFDVVTLNGCLEHLHKPKETLVKINKVIKYEGLLVITVPNFDSIGRILFGKDWYALQPPTHLYHFTPRTLINILELSGFKTKTLKYNYWKHNYSILFESIRLLFSPKFKISKEGFTNKNLSKKSKRTFYLESMKLFTKVIVFIISALEPVLKKGEVITVYAEKA